MSSRSVVLLYCLLAFNPFFSQGIRWEEALKQDPRNVLSLDCSGQKWDSLPLEIFQFTNLKELDLSKNKFNTLPQAFQTFAQLEKLNLGRNKFENFPLVICQLPLLKTLHLDRNQITLLPEQIADLQALEYLEKSKEVLDAPVKKAKSDVKIAEDAYKAKPEDKTLEMEYLKAKNHLQVLEEANADRMDIMRALKQLYVRLNLTEKFEAIKKEMQQ